MINRKDMYNDYSNKHIPYLYHTIFNRDVKASFEWGFGDTTTLYFDFEFDDCDPNPTWEGKTIEISIHNFRYEEIFKTEVEGDSHIAIPIDLETSKLFPKGIYYCFAKVIDSTTNSIQTVIGANDCMIYVR